MSNWSELHDAGYAAAEEGDLEKAVEFLKKAVEAVESNGNKEELCQSVNCLAVVYQALGQEDDAKTMFEKTISIKPETIELPAAIEALADLYSYEDEEKALELYNDALKEYVRLGEHDAQLDAQNKVLTILSFSEELEDGVLKERPLSKAETENFKRQADIGKQLIALDKKAKVTSPEVVQRIDSYVDAWQDAEVENELDGMDAAKALGALWAHELIESFNWTWVCLEGAGNLFVIVSEDRGLVINPVYFVKSCLDMPELDCTIMLAYNMLQESQFDEIPAMSFENVMEGVHRVIPKPGRSLSMAAGRLPE
ncbi:MAG: tetratricopeptide repeat protein [Candidatus Melainabacteria bacterium]|nr:tetratricopeptide repeat protein [Candidatus Melainabacteria bacterium]